MDGKASRRLNQSKSFNLPFSRYAQSCDTARHYLQQEFLRGEPSPGFFLDRDGTLNVDHGYVHEIDNFQFIDGTIEALQALKKMGYALVLVTNQSGIARGMFTEDQFMQLTEDGLVSGRSRCRSRRHLFLPASA